MTAATEVEPQERPAPQASVRERVDWAVVPRVNLLPQEILDARRFRRLQRVLIALVALIVVLAVAAVLWAQSTVAAAQSDLDSTRSQTTALQRQQTRYAEVPVVMAQLDSVRAARESALGSDVLWYRFLTDLAINTPTGTSLSSVGVTLNASAAPVGSTVPLTPAGLGTVKVTGRALKYGDVAGWLDDVDLVNGLAGSSLQSASTDGTATGAITYSGTAIVTGSALSHRYDRKAG
jgi:hypothetical protein